MIIVVKFVNSLWNNKSSYNLNTNIFSEDQLSNYFTILFSHNKLQILIIFINDSNNNIAEFLIKTTISILDIF